MSRGPYPFEPRASFAAPVIGLPGPADAYEPRPVLCIRPMTHGDARYQEGWRAGLLEAAAMLVKSAERLEAGQTDALDRLMATTFRSCAESLEFDAGGAP